MKHRLDRIAESIAANAPMTPCLCLMTFDDGKTLFLPESPKGPFWDSVEAAQADNPQFDPAHEPVIISVVNARKGGNNASRP